MGKISTYIKSGDRRLRHTIWRKSWCFAKRYEGISYFKDMAVGIMEQQIGVRLIYYKAENRWALAYRIRRRAVSFWYCLFRHAGAVYYSHFGCLHGHIDGLSALICMDGVLSIQKMY